MPALNRLGQWIISLIVVLLLTVYFTRAFDARHMRDLDPEHRVRYASELVADAEADTDWLAYLAIEDALSRELETALGAQPRPPSLVDRYSETSLTFPERYGRNWNRSYEIRAADPRGVAVLVHGLTDSPYSMRASALMLVDAGFDVVVPRMPGHGYSVSGLLQARWEDWFAALRIAIRHAATLRNGDRPFLLVGYSNGGLLAIDYALRCDAFARMPCPDGLVLLSPAIAVSGFASVANWHAAVSWLPFFEKFEWFEILPEVDPFKFTSFPKKAAWEIYEVASRTNDLLRQPSEVAKLPPILTFQSVVDDTIGAEALVRNLYSKLPANGSELVVYDVDRNSTMLQLTKTPIEDPVELFEAVAPLRFGVTVLSNRYDPAASLDIVTLAAGADRPIVDRTDLRWPVGVYSLSHIAVPFGADDPVYGDGSNPLEQGVVLGMLAPRGERGVLELTPEYFLRLRYNPFLAFQHAYLARWLDEHFRR